MIKSKKAQKQNIDTQSRPSNAEKKPNKTGEKSYGERLRQKTEEFINNHPTRLDETFFKKDVEECFHELSTYQTELELQNKELHKAQQELEESHRRLTDLYDFAPVGYFTFDSKGIIDTVNQTGASILGMDKNQLLRVPFNIFVHPEDTDRFNIYLQQTIREEEKQVEEFRLDKKSHDQIWVQMESIAVQDESGKITEIRTTATEITKRVRAEQQLQRKSVLLRTIIDSTDVLLACLDPEFNFLWVNPSFARAGKMTPEELAGKNHFTLYPHKENERVFQQVRDTGEPFFFKDKPFEYPDQPERGITYWDWSLVPVKDAADKVTAMVFSLRETTKYKLDELKLAEKEKHFRLIAENSADVIYQLETSGIISYMSPAISSFGYEPDEVLGWDLKEFIPAQEIDRAEKAWQQILKGKEIRLLELKVKKRDGTLADCEISVSPIMKDGEVVNILGITRDITERRQIEYALRENEAKLQTILDNLTEGVVVSDLQGELIYWNRAAVRMHGYTSDEEYLRNLHEFNNIFTLSTPEGEDLPLDKWPMSRILKGETLKRTELKVWRHDIDTRLFLKYSGSLARDRNDDPLMAILTISDITERILAEEKIQRNNALLQGIKEIFESGLRCNSDEELAVEALRVAERITESRFGFIGEIGPDGLLYDIAISDSGWQECTMDNRTGHRTPPGNFRIAGLYGLVLSEDKPFFTNEPSMHEASVSTPEGHPPLRCFLSVPIVHASTTIGTFSLANREGGYGEEDVDSVKALVDAFKEILFKFRMERELAKSEERERNNAKLFKQFLDFTPVPVWIAHDPKCKVITSNRAAAELLETEPDHNISQATKPDGEKPTIKAFRNGRELEVVDMPLQYAVRNAMPVDDVEMDLITPGKKTIRMVGAATPLYDARGNVSGGIGAFLDITDRKWLEEQLLYAKKEWEKTFDAVPDLIAILDPQYRIIRANKAMSEALGITPADCIGKHCFSCLHGSANPISECPNQLTLQDCKEHTAVVYEKKLEAYYLVTTTPFTSESGEMLATVHVARDITQLKKAEKLLRDNEKRLESAQKLAHLGSWELDTTNNILTWSDETFRIFGLEPQSFVPCYEDFYKLVHPDDRQMVHDTYFNSLQKVSDDRYEINHRIIIQPNDEIRYVHEKWRHVRDKNGQVIRSEGMVHDITGRELAEQQVHHLNRELQQSIKKLAMLNREYERSNQDLQQYAHIISHDLQEPLRTVAGFVQLLSRRYQGKLDDRADTFIEHTTKGTAHMQHLLQDLLEFSKIGGGKLSLKEISLEKVVEKTLSNLTQSIAKSDAKLEIAPLPMVTADELQLIHLFQNLIANALKFRGERAPRIRISAERRNAEWLIHIRDNGIGIDPKFADRIFVLFQRLHGRDKYSGGTGLGLAICKKVVERHEGRIWVESKPGNGSTFYFTLPAFQQDLNMTLSRKQQ